MRLTKKRVALCLAIGPLAVALFFGKPIYLVVNAWLHDAHNRVPTPLGFTDDVSRLNETPVAEIVDVAADPVAAQEQLRGLLERARKDKLGVAIAGAKHS